MEISGGLYTIPLEASNQRPNVAEIMGDSVQRLGKGYIVLFEAVDECYTP